MGAPQQMIGACNSGAIASITASSNWGTTTGSTSTISSATKTLTVPSGNPGSILLGLTTSGSHTRTTQYSKNGGVFTTFLDGAVISVASTNTLGFQMTGAVSTDIMDISIGDNTTSVLIGTCELERS